VGQEKGWCALPLTKKVKGLGVRRSHGGCSVLIQGVQKETPMSPAIKFQGSGSRRRAGRGLIVAMKGAKVFQGGRGW